MAPSALGLRSLGFSELGLEGSLEWVSWPAVAPYVAGPFMCQKPGFWGRRAGRKSSYPWRLDQASRANPGPGVLFILVP